jgi:hypothetical protein
MLRPAGPRECVAVIEVHEPVWFRLDGVLGLV